MIAVQQHQLMVEILHSSWCCALSLRLWKSWPTNFGIFSHILAWHLYSFLYVCTASFPLWHSPIAKVVAMLLSGMIMHVMGHAFVVFVPWLEVQMDGCFYPKFIQFILQVYMKMTIIFAIEILSSGVLFKLTQTQFSIQNSYNSYSKYIWRWQLYLQLKFYPQVYGFNLKRSKGAELRILIVFSYYAILGISGLTAITASSRNLSGYYNARNTYFLCERNGIGAECDRSGFESYINPGLAIVGFILVDIYPAVNLVYVIHIADLKNLKQRCAPCCK